MAKLIINLPDRLYETLKERPATHSEHLAMQEYINDGIPVAEIEENILKFYYVESLGEYWIGKRLDTMYYAEWHDEIGFVWTHSRYLPWGEHVVAPNTLWKEHTYPSEPKEIPFTEWIKGFLKTFDKLKASI